MPLQTTLGSLSSSISRVSAPIGGYYFGTKTIAFNDMTNIGVNIFTCGKTSNIAYVSKYDGNHLLEWTVKLQSTGETTEFINIATFNNYLYVFGYATSAGSYYPIIAKYDVDGNLIWQRKVDGLLTTFQCMKSGTVDINGNMYMALQLTLRSGTITLANIQTGSGSYCAVKMLEDGTISWQTKLGYNKDISSQVQSGTTYYYWRYSCDVVPIKIQVDTSGGVYILSAVTYAFGLPGSTTSPPGNPTSLDIRGPFTRQIVKFDSTGTLSWQKQFTVGGQTTENFINDIFIDSANHLYACGREYWAIADNTANNLQTNGAFILKINISTGAIIWHLDIGPNAHNPSGPWYNLEIGADWKSIATDPYGNVYVVGVTCQTVGAAYPTYTNVIVKVVDPGSSAPTAINFSNQYTNATRIDVFSGRLYVTNGTVWSTWSMNGGYPYGVSSWPSLPVTYNANYIPLEIYTIDSVLYGWDQFDTFYAASTYSSITSSVSSFTTSTQVLSQTLVYFK